MPSLVVSCHGGRGAGTSTGTYVIPKGVKVYFFTDDAVNLNGGSISVRNGKRVASAASYLECLLLTAHPDESKVQGLASEVKKEYETVPNYEASGARAGDKAFNYPTGLYWVGSDQSNGPMFPIAHGNEYSLSEIIGGGCAGGVLSPVIYWLCCRFAPRNSNNTSSVKLGKYGLMDEGKASGLKPSQIVKLGGQWR